MRWRDWAVWLPVLVIPGAAVAQPTFTPIRTFTAIGTFTPIKTFTPIRTLTPIETFTPVPTTTRPGRTATSTSSRTPPRTATRSATGTPTGPAATRTPTPTRTPIPSDTRTPFISCVGDCDGDGVIVVNEIILGVLIAQDPTGLPFCRAFDSNLDGLVSIDELIRSVSFGLSGCP